MLLKNIEFEQHKPQDDHYVYYIQLPTGKISKPNQFITARISNIIQTDILDNDKEYSDIFELLEDIRRWLEQKQTRRLLAEELQDAINLVCQPFEVMGYRFESLDLIIRILAETNYYPSLIQLFCMSLQAYLHTSKVWKEEDRSLPVMISMRDILL